MDGAPGRYRISLAEYDDKTAAFLKTRKRMQHQLSWAKPVSADADAEYCQTVEIDL